MTPSSGMTRRRLLAASAATALGASGLPLLGACSDGTSQQNTAARNANTKLPSYLPVFPAQPDLPGNDKGAMPGYIAYPRDTKPAFSSLPAEGLGEVTVLYPTFNPIPPPMDRNAFWQEVNKALGATLKLNIAPSGEYPNKFQTTIAGDKLPDIVVFENNTPRAPQVLSHLFADLSPYLAGDAVKDFPYLANIPTQSWRHTVFNGVISAVPQPRSVAGEVLFFREDIVAEVGGNPAPASYQEFLDLAKAVTDPKKNRWAFANPGRIRMHLLMMLGAPNGWTVQDGKFVHGVTDERAKEATALVADMVKQGLFHPDSAGASYTQARDFFTAGRSVIHSDGYAAWDLLINQIGEKVGAIVEPKRDGGGDARHFARAAATQATTAIRKGLGEEKTRKLLNVLNWLAAPIGTVEHLLRKYGVEGTGFTWSGDVPTLTDRGKLEKLDLQYITDAPTILGPGPRERVIKQHAWHTRVTKDLVYDASAGLYSDTMMAKGPEIWKATNSVEADIIHGRKPLSSWDDAVKQWRSRGGDQAAREYEKAYEKATG